MFVLFLSELLNSYYTNFSRRTHINRSSLMPSMTSKVWRSSKTKSLGAAALGVDADRAGPQSARENSGHPSHPKLQLCFAEPSWACRSSSAWRPRVCWEPSSSGTRATGWVRVPWPRRRQGLPATLLPSCLATRLSKFTESEGPEAGTNTVLCPCSNDLQNPVAGQVLWALFCKSLFLHKMVALFTSLLEPHKLKTEQLKAAPYLVPLKWINLNIY